MCVFLLCERMHTCVCVQVPTEAITGHRSPGVEVAGVCEPPTWVLGSELWSLWPRCKHSRPLHHLFSPRRLVYNGRKKKKTLRRAEFLEEWFRKLWLRQRHNLVAFAWFWDNGLTLFPCPSRQSAWFCLSAFQMCHLPSLAKLHPQTEVGGGVSLRAVAWVDSFLCPECWVQLSEEFR